MDSQDRAELKARLSTYDDHERRKLAKRAAALRHEMAARARPPRRSRFADEEDEGIAPPRRASMSVEEAMLRLLREEKPPDAAQTGIEPDGLVTALAKGRAWVRTAAGEEIEADLAPEIKREQERAIAVGDLVLVRKGRVERVFPRRTRLSRPDPGGGGERVIVANVDAAVITVAVTAPPLHPRIIDRYLLACERGGIAPIVVANKWDILADGPPGQDASLEPYRRIGVPVVPVSAATGLGLAELGDLIAGKLVAFVGHSGVGKSSLVNALDPTLDIAVGSLAPGRGTGRHTTRGSRIYDLGRARVVDTPGVRSFGLWALSVEELAWHFPEFAGLRCRFRDCAHGSEPGCAVREAVREGVVSEARFETYLRLRSSLVAGAG